MTATSLPVGATGWGATNDDDRGVTRDNTTAHGPV